MEQVIIEEAGWASRRHNKGSSNLLRIAQSSRHLILAFLATQGLHHLLRELVDHWVPDGTGELQEMGVEWAKLGQDIQVDGARVVLVKDTCLAIVDDQAGVTQRAIDGGGHGDNGEAQAIHFDRLAVFGIY